MSNLTEYTSRMMVPAVQGVQHHAIRDPDAGDDTGFAVTLVPKSEGLPHLPEAKEQHRYYYRSSDSFYIVEHFMLADRFGRRPQPKLDLMDRWDRTGGQT